MTSRNQAPDVSPAERLCRLAVRGLTVITIVALVLFVLQVAFHTR